MQEYCRVHVATPRWKKNNIDPRKNCPACQSIAAAEKSTEISKNHVFGKKCKEHNQCRTCCSIRFYTRLLIHFSGSCNNRVCPVCEWKKEYRGVVYLHYHAKFFKRNIKMVNYKLYSLLLGGGGRLKK